jgi:steroid delta-isomerase-like uncharacterized protein
MATVAINLEKWIKDEEAAWASHDLDKMVAVYTDDCIYEDVALGKVMQGKEAIRAFFREFLTACPDDGSLMIKSPFASGNRMCMEFIMAGTIKGSFLGLPVTGKTISIRGVHICELRGDKVSRVSDYWDMASVMRQLGLFPPMSQQ